MFYVVQKILFFLLLIIGQTVSLSTSTTPTTEVPEDKETGALQGRVITNDNQPAENVTVTLKEFNGYLTVPNCTL